jgi:hypothetical protein
VRAAASPLPMVAKGQTGDGRDQLARKAAKRSTTVA